MIKVKLVMKDTTAVMPDVMLLVILDMILAVPTYAVVKTITKNIVRLFKLYRTRHTVITEDT